MRLFLFFIAFLAIFVNAQLGIVQSTSGIHVPSAKTPSQGFLTISGNFEMVSDGEPLGINGYFVNSQGETVALESNIPSNSTNVFASFAFLDNLEIGLGLPFHYEGDIEGTNLDGLAMGDLEIFAKGYFPISERISFGLSGSLLFPSGAKSKGFRPRHVWNILQDDNVYAYTADNIVLNANVHLSANIIDALEYNGYFGLLRVIGQSEHFLLWGSGFTLFPQKVLSLILEVSGETPIRTHHMMDNFATHPIRFTPGLRISLPGHTMVTLSGDFGINNFRDYGESDGLPVNLKSGGSDFKFFTPSMPSVAVAISVTKQFDFSWTDSDGDGVIDRNDLCPGTAHAMAVNKRGCPIDEDQDGVLNIVDLCPGTPLGLTVDYNGCPLDTDEDGVPDYVDACPQTPKGYAVDAKGCPVDSDGDGVNDNFDLCPNTRKGDAIDKDGCPLDADHDMVPNDIDQCPNTPEGISVDSVGCPLDFDHDGIPDDYDECPNSVPGEIVNSRGCPSDKDLDGVPDSKDKCPETPEGALVDEFGCRLDQDGDGIFDELDKCSNTPEGAPVDSVGCPLDSDGDGIADWQDQCPNSLQGVRTDKFGCPIDSKYNMNDMARRVIFKSKDTTLLNSSYTALNDVIYLMRIHPIELEVQCSANEMPEDQADALSEQRATVIYNYLEYKGIAAERIKYKGYGKKLPPTLTQKNGSTDQVRFIPQNKKQDK